VVKKRENVYAFGVISKISRSCADGLGLVSNCGGGIGLVWFGLIFHLVLV
jgi:hypothetical protein